MQQFNLVSQFVGKGSIADLATLSSPHYSFDIQQPGSRTSVTKWKEKPKDGSTTAPTKRVIRTRDKPASFAYLLTVQFNSIQLLDTLKIGYTQFKKPSHNHVVPDRRATWTPASGAVGPVTLNFKFPDGSDCPYACVETTTSTIVGFTADASGVVSNAGISSGQGIRARDAGGNWGAITTLTSNPQTITLGSYLRSHSATGGTDQVDWHINAFSAWGVAELRANHDWMPPLYIESLTPGPYDDPLSWDAELSLLITDRFRTQDTIYTDPLTCVPMLLTLPDTDMSKRPSITEHDAIPSGWFSRNASYPTSFQTNRWVAVPGSVITGYTPPADEPASDWETQQGTI